MFQPAATKPIDADLWWIVYLRGALVGRPESYATGVWFDRTVPTTRRDRMVIVRRDGGAVSGLFDKPRITLDVWAQTEQDATNLAGLIVGLSLKAPLAGAGVTYVSHLSGPNSVPVTGPEGARRHVLIEAHHRATIVTP